ncbi:hypothetical protein ACET3Z_011753 [Daucus carota]
MVVKIDDDNMIPVHKFEFVDFGDLLKLAKSYPNTDPPEFSTGKALKLRILIHEDNVKVNSRLYFATDVCDASASSLTICSESGTSSTTFANGDGFVVKVSQGSNTPGTAKSSSKRVKLVSFFGKSKLDNFCLNGCLCLHCKLCEYATDSCMERILERYERYAYAERQLVATDIETQGSWNLEHAKLQARIEVLQKNERHYMGEDLDSLSLKELHNLEHQLDSALKQIRSRKSQLMFESISQLQRKDKNLQEHNNLLLKKANGKEKEIYQPPPVEQQNDGNSSTALPNQLHSVNIGTPSTSMDERNIMVFTEYKSNRRL